MIAKTTIPRLGEMIPTWGAESLIARMEKARQLLYLQGALTERENSSVRLRLREAWDDYSHAAPER